MCVRSNGNFLTDLDEYVIPDEDFHRRLGKDGAIDFRTIDCGDWRPVIVVMAAIVRPRC